MSAPVVTKWRVVDAEGRTFDYTKQPENPSAFPCEWQDADGPDWRWRVILGDCRKVMATMPESSIDAVVTDPPYGLEFMGKEWDSFRLDDPGTQRNRGERAGAQGEAGKERPSGITALGASGGVAIGGGKHPMTSRCTGCGKRDQFRNPHECKPEAKWKTEPIDPHCAPPTMLAFGEWCRLWALEALRVMKPGAHILSFGGMRTFHRLACGVEEAGAEIRDALSWIYGSR